MVYDVFPRRCRIKKSWLQITVLQKEELAAAILRQVVIRPLQLYLMSAGGHLNGAEADNWAGGKQLHDTSRIHTREVLTGSRCY